MKIILIHGDNSLASDERLRSYLAAFKQSGGEIARINSQKNFSFAEELSSRSLFTAERLFLLDNFLGLTKKDFAWLKKNATALPGTLIIYHANILSKEHLNSFPPEIKIEAFKLPKTIYAFLNSFYPNNAHQCLTLLHQLIQTEPIEFIFSLLCRHIRDLYWASIDPKALVYPDWRILRLIAQAKKFRKEALKKIISRLAEADILAKKSKLGLKDSLDQLIISQLE